MPHANSALIIISHHATSSSWIASSVSTHKTEVLEINQAFTLLNSGDSLQVCSSRTPQSSHAGDRHGSRKLCLCCMESELNRAREASSLSGCIRQHDHHKIVSTAHQVCKKSVYSYETNTINHNFIYFLIHPNRSIKHKNQSSAKQLAG